MREGVELLRPHPHRGDLIAGGAVPLTVALLLINLRLDDSWGSGVFFVLDLLACGLVLGMGVLAPMEEERPRAYQLVLQLTGLVLLFLTLFRLAQIFGVEEPLGSAWTAFLILALVSAAAAWLARERHSEVCTLIAGVTGTFALLAFVDLVFSPDGATTPRWILLLAAILLLGGSLVLRDRHRRESVYLIDAAGVAILVLGITFIGELLFGAVLSIGSDELLNRASGPGVIWKVVLLACGLGLVALRRRRQRVGAGLSRRPDPADLRPARRRPWRGRPEPLVLAAGAVARRRRDDRRRPAPAPAAAARAREGRSRPGRPRPCRPVLATRVAAAAVAPALGAAPAARESSLRPSGTARRRGRRLRIRAPRGRAASAPGPPRSSPPRRDPREPPGTALARRIRQPTGRRAAGVDAAAVQELLRHT